MSKSDNAPNKGRKKIWFGMLLLLVLAGGVGVYWYYFMRGVVRSDDARLDGDLVDVAPRITGPLAQLLVGEGDRVKKDQLLFMLDKTLLEATLAKAEAAEQTARARLGIAEAELAKVISGPRAAEIQVAEAAAQKSKTAEDLAKSDWTRSKSLYLDRNISAAERDKAHANWLSSRFAYQEDVKRLKLFQEGSRDEDIRSARATLAMVKAQWVEAQAAVEQANVNLSYAQVRAPFDGVVVRKWQHPGAMLSAGRPVLTLFNPDTLYVSANVEEKNLGRIKAGDKVDITVDAFPDEKITGRLDRVLLATNSEFSLIPSEGVSGTYIKVAQRVPIRITLDPHPPLPFGPGLSVEIGIHVRNSDS